MGEGVDVCTEELSRVWVGGMVLCRMMHCLKNCWCYVGPQIPCKSSLSFGDVAWGGAPPLLCISIHPVEGAGASPTPTGSKGAAVLLELLLTTSICNGHQDAIGVLSSGGTSMSDVCLRNPPMW